MEEIFSTTNKLRTLFKLGFADFSSNLVINNGDLPLH